MNTTISKIMEGAREYYAQCNEPGREREVSNDFTHLGSIPKQEKLKEQNSSRLTEPKNGLIIRKRKRTPVDGFACCDMQGESRYYDWHVYRGFGTGRAAQNSRDN